MNTKMMFTRSIKGLPSTIFVILLATRRLMPVSELVIWADSNDDDVRKALKVLEGLQVVSADVRARGEKWYGLAQGYQAMLPGMFQVEDQLAGLLPGSEKSDSEIVESPDLAENGAFSPQNAPESEKSDSDLSSLERLESKTLKNLEESNSLDSDQAGADFSDAEFAGKTTVEILCKESFRLLGKSVRCDEKIRARPIREILAWIAQGYQSRDELMSPVGFVYKAICHQLKTGNKVQANKQPDPQYLASPFEYLSYDFLNAVGLGEYHIKRCRHCGQTGEHLESCITLHQKWTETETRVVSTLPLEDVLEGEWPQTTEAQLAAVAWGNLKEQLAHKMPPASYETWLKDARLLGCKDGVVYIATRNAYARDWVEERLGDAIRLHLSETLSTFYHGVAFVARPGVSTETEAADEV